MNGPHLASLPTVDQMGENAPRAGAVARPGAQPPPLCPICLGTGIGVDLLPCVDCASEPGSD